MKKLKFIIHVFVIVIGILVLCTIFINNKENSEKNDTRIIDKASD